MKIDHKLTENLQLNLCWVFIGSFLLVVAMLWNLGAVPMFVHTDEPRRALVSYEMLLRNDWLTPTINGEPYFNKPPGYNWIIMVSYLVFGVNEWALRLPTVFFVFLFSAIQFFVFKKIAGTSTALLSCMFFLTNFRLLFYDSFLGMIDVCFGMVLFCIPASFLLLGEKKHFKLIMFTSVYLFAVYGYLLKGLPAIMMLVFTLMLWGGRDLFRKLFTKQHVFGVFVGAAAFFSFYSLYLIRNPEIGWETIADIVLSESSKRTVVRFGIVETLKHIATFPFDFILNFCPWSLFVFLLLNRKIRVKIFSDRLAMFCGLCFLVNIIPYWISPEVSPRYLYMLIPLFFFVCARAFIYSADLGLNSWLFGNRVLYFAVFIAFARVLYSGFALPHRAKPRHFLKDEAIATAVYTRGEPLFLYAENWLQDGTTFYIEATRKDILRTKNELVGPAYFLVSAELAQSKGLETKMKMHTLFTDKPLHLVWVE